MVLLPALNIADSVRKNCTRYHPSVTIYHSGKGCSIPEEQSQRTLFAG